MQFEIGLSFFKLGPKEGPKKYEISLEETCRNSVNRSIKIFNATFFFVLIVDDEFS